MPATFADRYPIREFERFLAEWVDAPGVHERLRAAMREALLGGGKRFRAVLVMAAAELAGRAPADAFPLAAAVEMVHAYSLVHDDLPCMDNAELRRGRPTLHRQFGEALALLAGDALLADAFAMLATTKAPPRRVLAVSAALGTAAGRVGMVGGQVGDVLDLPAVTDVAQVRSIHAGKTGALIIWSLVAPLDAFGAPKRIRRRVAQFADRLGVLYQVRDDLLDLDPGAARDKDRGADGGKSTYARLLGPAGASAAAARELRLCLADAARLPAPHAERFAALAEWTVGRRA